MPEYIVTDPRTGRRVRLSGDSAPTEAELEKIFEGIPQGRRPFPDQQSPIGAAIEQRSMSPLTEAARRELVGGTVTGAAYGAAKPFIGAMQLGMKLGERVLGTREGRTPLSDQVTRGLEGFEQARSEAGGSNVPVFAGQVATGAALTGGIAPAAGFIGRAGQGLGLGAIMGAVEPVTSTDANFETAKVAQMATGAAVGTGMSLLGSMGRTLARRILPKGAELEAGRVANEIAGERQPQVVAALQANQQPGLTAGQAATPAGSAEFSALQRRASQVRGAASQYQDIAQAQNAQRATALSAIAGTSDDIANLQRTRTAATSPLYEAADLSKAPADVTRTLRLIDGITARRSNESAFNVLGNVRQTLLRPFFKDADMLVPEERVPQLISASRNLSQLLDAKDPMGRPVNQAISRELTTIKKSLDAQIAKAAPEFGQAQKLFADLSKPIDRMKVGQYIQDRLIPAINDVGADAPQRATVFANAMRDMNESVRAATGFKRGGGLADLMTPDELLQLGNIGSGLARDVDLQRLAQAGSRGANDVTSEMFKESIGNFLNPVIAITNAILRRTGSPAAERTMSVIAQNMQDPAAMARIMQAATVAERRAIERGIMLYMTSGAVSSPDDAVGWSRRAINTGLQIMAGDEQDGEQTN